MSQSSSGQKRPTLFLANAYEWGAGLLAFLATSLLFEKIAYGMPIMLLAAGMVIWGLVYLRLKRAKLNFQDAVTSEREFNKNFQEIANQEIFKSGLFQRILEIVICLLICGALIFTWK